VPQVEFDYIAAGNRTTGITDCYCRGAIYSQSQTYNQLMGYVNFNFDVTPPAPAPAPAPAAAAGRNCSSSGSEKGGGGGGGDGECVKVQLCRLWWNGHAQLTTMRIVSVLVVICVNLNLSDAMQYIVRYERHESITAEISAAIHKIFLCQFANTGLLTLLVNMNLRWFHPTLGDGVLTGMYDDFDVGWYEHVGSSLLLAMLLNCFIPQLKYILQQVRRQVSK
jgi:hypothetical protein